MELDPQPDGSTQVAWGDPAAWPPAYHERFVRDGGWVRLIGFGDDRGDVADQVVTREQIGDVNCRTTRALPVDGRQHYVQWTIPASAYCLEAWGFIDHQGIRVDFYHRQVWFPPSAPTCANRHQRGKVCVKQWETWSDNNGAPGGPLVQRHRRDNVLAAGHGPGFVHHDYLTGWHAEGPPSWAW